LPPPPTPGPDNEFIPWGNNLLEVDENHVPQGVWHFNENNNTWIFDRYVPADVFHDIPGLRWAIPQTGDTSPANTALRLGIAVAALAATGTASIIVKKRRRLFYRRAL